MFQAVERVDGVVIGLAVVAPGLCLWHEIASKNPRALEMSDTQALIVGLIAIGCGTIIGTLFFWGPRPTIIHNPPRI